MFAGDYETVDVEHQADGCGQPTTPQPIGDDMHWFRLDDVTAATGPLVAYYPCSALGDCVADYDLYRSFGKTGADWMTTISAAFDPGCRLQYRERRLTRVDDTTIETDDLLYAEVDGSLSGDACSIAEAKQRGTSMPCVEETVSLADVRDATSARPLPAR